MFWYIRGLAYQISIKTSCHWRQAQKFGRTERDSSLRLAKRNSFSVSFQEKLMCHVPTGEEKIKTWNNNKMAINCWISTVRPSIASAFNRWNVMLINSEMLHLTLYGYLKAIASNRKQSESLIRRGRRKPDWLRRWILRHKCQLNYMSNQPLFPY